MATDDICPSDFRQTLQEGCLCPGCDKDRLSTPTLPSFLLCTNIPPSTTSWLHPLVDSHHTCSTFPPPSLLQHPAEPPRDRTPCPLTKKHLPPTLPGFFFFFFNGEEIMVREGLACFQDQTIICTTLSKSLALLSTACETSETSVHGREPLPLPGIFIPAREGMGGEGWVQVAVDPSQEVAVACRPGPCPCCFQEIPELAYWLPSQIPHWCDSRPCLLSRPPILSPSFLPLSTWPCLYSPGRWYELLSCLPYPSIYTNHYSHSLARNSSTHPSLFSTHTQTLSRSKEVHF